MEGILRRLIKEIKGIKKNDKKIGPKEKDKKRGLFNLRKRRLISKESSLSTLSMWQAAGPASLEGAQEKTGFPMGDTKVVFPPGTACVQELGCAVSL